MAAMPQLVVGEDVSLVNRIRVETSLSRFPIHRLSKTGTAIIDLFPDIQWRVSHNTDYGQPGPLAYKIDTLIINRRLDQAPRPLPEVLRLGSLREICRELGQSDHDTDIVKRALHQNASAYITAKVRQTKKVREKWVEIGYTRYSIVFTGEVLPNGSTADAVYVVLNPQHRKFLNEVEVRPLDYDYLFQLAPAPQRLYELLSFPVFGALSNDRPRARLRYSEFCTFAPVTRYFDYDPVKKQMSKINKPHRQSGYILKVEFQETQDAKGNRDWEMLYTPGPKAVAEFNAFTRRSIPVPTIPVLPPATGQIIEGNAPAIQGSLDLLGTDKSLFDELVRRGITPNKARELLAGAKQAQNLVDQLEYTDLILQQAPAGKFHNPPGLYIRYIEQNITPPPTFESSRKRRLREEAQQVRDMHCAQVAHLQMAYEEYQREQVEQFIAKQLPQEEYTSLFSELRRHNKKAFKSMTAEQLDESTHTSVRAHLRHSGQVAMLSLDQFSQEADAH